MAPYRVFTTTLTALSFYKDMMPKLMKVADHVAEKLVDLFMGMQDTVKQSQKLIKEMHTDHSKVLKKSQSLVRILEKKNKAFEDRVAKSLLGFQSTMEEISFQCECCRQALSLMNVAITQHQCLQPWQMHDENKKRK